MEDEEKPQQNNEKKMHKRAMLASAGVGVLLIVGAVAYTSQSSKSDDSAASNVIISTEELAAYDGKNGAKCYVAVDKTVYEIKQGRKWKDGEHITSEGQAYCGRDLSDVINKSPHGKSILSILTEVGKLK